jgi:hypothetical protein
MRQLRRWLSQIRYARILTTGVAFVAGVLATGIIHTFTTTRLLSTPQGVKWGIISFLALIVALCVVLIIEYHTRVLDTLETKFGLQAEFILDKRGDHKGLSYKAIQKYIEAANKSLIFVDSWVESSTYSKSKERKDYYRAIEERIRKHLDSDRSESDWFYQRIVQLPDGMSPKDIAQDTVYADHLEECAKLEEKGTTGTIFVGTAKPFTHTHFAIIDDLYFVQPILTERGKQQILDRHGVIIYTDVERRLVTEYKQILRSLDERSKLHMGQIRAYSES